MIAARSILYPVIALVALTAVVGVLMYRRRVAEMRERRIPPQAVAISAQMAERLMNTSAADNFRNLHETPVVFYAAALAIYAGHLTDPIYLALAWAYVAARLVHSAIHCTYNRVMHRLSAFLASLTLLWIVWARIAWDLLVAGRG